MDRKILLNFSIATLILCCQSSLFGETIKLKSGKVIEGNIMERTNDYIRIDIGGVGITYYFDEIDSINGNLVKADDFLLSVQEGLLSAEKRADIKKLLDITGALKIGQQFSEFFFKQTAEGIRRSRPDIPQKMFDILYDEINKTLEEAIHQEDGFIELIAQIYHKYLTHEDIKGLLEFYQTRLGKKVIVIMPVLTQESLAAGQLWGESLEPTIKQRVIQRFRKEGINLSL